MGFELGERHFNRIEIGAVRWEEEEPGATLFEDGLGLIALMAGQVVENDDIARSQRRRELRLDVDLEDLLGHWAVDDPGRCQPVAAQPGNKGLGLPMPKRRTSPEPLATKGSTAQSGHLRRGRRFIYEDQPVRLIAHLRLAAQPPPAPRFAHVIASAFRCQKLFFYI